MKSNYTEHELPILDEIFTLAVAKTDTIFCLWDTPDARVSSKYIKKMVELRRIIHMWSDKKELNEEALQQIEKQLAKWDIEDEKK